MNQKGREELDEQLKQLALEAQKHPPKTEKRQVALTKLVNEIQRSGLLYRPHQSRLLPDFYSVYEDIYDEAKQKLMLHICKNIEQYDSERGKVMTWVNLLMDKRFFNEASNELRKIKDIGINMIRNRPFEQWDTLEVENAFISGTTLFPLEEIRWFIEQDPDEYFQNVYIEGKPEISFKLLLLKKLDGDSWREISEDLKTPLPTLHSFYKRNLKKFAPKLKAYLSQ